MRTAPRAKRRTGGGGGELPWKKEEEEELKRRQLAQRGKRGSETVPSLLLPSVEKERREREWKQADDPAAKWRKERGKEKEENSGGGGE